MRRNIYATLEDFIKEIRDSINEIPVEDIRKSVRRFTNRVRRVEINRGRYLIK